MGEGTFNEMACVVPMAERVLSVFVAEEGVTRNLQFVHISQVGKALPRLNHRVMNIQIAIWMLGRANHLHQFLDCRIDLGVEVIRKQVTGTLDPFGHVGIPELVIWNRIHSGRVRIARVPLELECIVPTCLFQHLKLMPECLSSNDFATTGPK